jgi:hypothetical protein
MLPQFLFCAAQVVGVQPQTPGVPPPPHVCGALQHVVGELVGQGAVPAGHWQAPLLQVRPLPAGPHAVPSAAFG